jgi:hypothetical protein
MQDHLSAPLSSVQLARLQARPVKTSLAGPPCFDQVTGSVKVIVMIGGIRHPSALTFRDVDASATWYVDVLGFRRVGDRCWKVGEGLLP